MSIIVKEIETGLDENPQVAVERAIALLGLDAGAVQSACIAKTSLDARRRDRVHFVHSVSIALAQDEVEVVQRCDIRQVSLQSYVPLEVTPGTQPMEHRPVIAGFGPAGMFAGLLLARYGYRPLVLERGAAIEKRAAAVSRFGETGTLDENTNVQFGEGGAGAFSDGKLTTRIGDPKCTWILEELVRFGAPQEILHQAKPHVGTDRLREIVRNLREEIIRLGGEVRFETPLTDLRFENNHLCAVKMSDGELPASALVLATGHSARETFEMLATHGVALQPKPFSVGVRIEHLQASIDRGLYGELAGHPALPKGEYQLSHRENDRGVYTFCMCPGGVVVPAASQQEMVVTNGMSYHARDGKNANCALVVSVTPEDYGNGALDGVRFQQSLERAAFQAGGGGYRAPAQDVGSFLQGKAGLKTGKVAPSYQCGVQAADFGALLPKFVTDLLRDGLRRFDRRLSGFAAPDALLTGLETRTSSPVRILRGEDLQAIGLPGLYPCAEGAGYAGGIMSAAADGLRVALEIITCWAPPKSADE